MRFVETPVFTRAVSSYLDDDRYQALQVVLLLRPEQGTVMPGSSGLRKLRWGATGRSKRGGYRIIYFYDKSRLILYMLYIYPKNKQEDLTASQLRILSRLIREEFK